MSSIISLILADGKGTRMQSADRHKVCFDIAGRPAIVRAIDTYKSCGIEQHVVVVGALAGQVIETVGRHHEGVIFAYQAEQRGTGHAAKQGARVLADLRYTGAVLVVAGDRLLDAQAVEQLLTEFRTTNCDMAFLVGERSGSELGHVVRDEVGAVLGIIEHKDVLARQALAEVRRLALAASAPDGDLAGPAKALMADRFPDPRKAKLAEPLPPEILHPLIGGQPDPEARYPVRGVVLFGLAECERSRLAPQLLAAGDLAGFGRLMRISHDGDRVVAYDDAWQPHPAIGPSGNAYLLDLMADLESGEPERVLAAQLHQQPGAYACSTPELDLIVDVALRTEGVIGAQLAGAGLGGDAMALVREDRVPALEEAPILRYYEPRNLPPAVLPCVPIGGRGVLMANQT